SSYWNAAVAEYGVGPATATEPMVFDESELLSDDSGTTVTAKGVIDFLATRLDGAHEGWAAADESAIYLLLLPTDVNVARGGLQSCAGFSGYHGAAFAAGASTRFAYAVIPACAKPGWTAVMSHELVEAATDPFGDLGAFGYAAVDQDHAVYDLFPGG